LIAKSRQEHPKQEHPKNEKSAMKLNRTFAAPAEMPATIPLFPMAGALLLPRRPIQLTVFEPRYLEMLDDALAGERLIGVIQPSSEEEATDPAPELYPLGCAGRIVQYAEIGDGRCLLPLMGVARFRLTEETPSDGPYRVAIPDYSPFAEDFLEGAGEAAVDREDLIAALKRFAEVHEIKVVWSDIKKASNEALVNGLSMMSPCGPREKQALLEAKDLKSRAEMLVAITTIELARGQDAAMQIH
jgi:Lon protease-like protein